MRKNVPCKLPLFMAGLMCLPAANGEILATGLYHDVQFRFAAQPPAASRVEYSAQTGGNVGFEARYDRDIFYVHAELAPVTDMDRFMELQRASAQKLCTHKARFTESATMVGGVPGTQMRMDCSAGAVDEARVVVVQATMREVENEGPVVYTVGMVTAPNREEQMKAHFQDLSSSFQLL